MSKGVGKPKVGGPFTLIDHDGKEFTDADMKGGFSIVRSLPITLHPLHLLGLVARRPD